jgi:ankyrin repeat protein
MTFDEANKVIKKGDLTRLRHELEDGLSPNLSNRYSWTLLMVAAMEGDTRIGRLLIEKGADLDTRNNGRETALSLAAHTGHPSFVKLLLSSGASLECHPFGNHLDVWLDWVKKYSGHPAQVEQIRDWFESERKMRSGLKQNE